MIGTSKGCERIKGFDRKKNPKFCRYPVTRRYHIEGGLGATEMELCSLCAKGMGQDHPHWKFYPLDERKVS